ncbi:MAG: hypothetical protein Kow00107_01620 [Planctomycetota bacterium]
MKRHNDLLTPVATQVKNGISCTPTIRVNGDTFTLSGKIRILDGK